MFLMKVASILMFLNFDGQSRASSLSLGESASRRRGGRPALRIRVGEDQPLGWGNWGVPAAGQDQNLIREGSAGQDDRDLEEASGSGDGGGVDDEDLVGLLTLSAGAPHSSSISPPVVERQERKLDGETVVEAKDWSEEYEYDSDNYIEVDDDGDVNYDTVKTLLPKLITESQLVLVTEGSEIVLPCQVGQSRVGNALENVTGRLVGRFQNNLESRWQLLSYRRLCYGSTGDQILGKVLCLIWQQR